MDKCCGQMETAGHTQAGMTIYRCCTCGTCFVNKGKMFEQMTKEMTGLPQAEMTKVLRTYL